MAEATKHAIEASIVAAMLAIAVAIWVLDSLDDHLLLTPLAIICASGMAFILWRTAFSSDQGGPARAALVGIVIMAATVVSLMAVIGLAFGTSLDALPKSLELSGIILRSNAMVLVPLAVLSSMIVRWLQQLSL